MIHNTHFSQYIPPTLMYGTVATWGMTAGQVSNTVVYKCDATDEVAVLWIPIQVMSNSVANTGVKLESIEIDFEILVAACDAMSAVIYKVARGADGAVAVVSTPAFTYDAGHDSAAERIDVDQHKMTLTITTPEWVDNDVYYLVALSFDKAATSTVEALAAVANFTLRA